MSTRTIAAALALTLPLAAGAQGRARAAGASTAPPRAAAPAPTAGPAAASRTRAATVGRDRTTPPARPASPVPGYSGWARGDVRHQGQRPPRGSWPYGSPAYDSRPYDSRPYRSGPFGHRYHRGYGWYPYLVVVAQPYPFVHYEVDRRAVHESAAYAGADVDAAGEPAVRDPGARGPAVSVPLVVEPLAGSLLRLRWVGTDTTVREVTLLLADAQRRPLVSQTVHARPFTAVLERTAPAAFIGVAVVHADGASTTTLLPMPAAAAGRER